MTGTRAIDFTIFIRAESETVWETLTSVKAIPEWSYPDSAEIDRLEVGGTYRWHCANDHTTDTAEILELEPGRKIVYRWSSSEPEPTIVSCELSLEDEKYTRLHFRNTGFGEGEAWDRLYHADYEGWVGIILNLKRSIEERAGVKLPPPKKSGV